MAIGKVSGGQPGHVVTAATRSRISLALTGRRASQETREKHRQAMLRIWSDPAVKAGRVAKMVGRHVSEDACKRMSIAQRGIKKQPQSLALRLKRSMSTKGRHFTEQHRRNLAEGCRRRSSSPEYRSKLVEAASRRTVVEKRAISEKISFALKGRKFRPGDPAKEALRRQRLSAALKGKKKPHCKIDPEREAIRRGKIRQWWAMRSAEDRAVHSMRVRSGIAAHRSSGTKVKRTSIEAAVASVLDRLGVAYVFQHPMAGYVADFFVPSRSLVIECDGEYWHSRPHCAARDRRKDETFMKLGYSVLRLPEREIRSGRSAIVVEQLFGIV